MILSLENTSAIGKPCQVFDADGKEIDHPVWADTETGECICICLDERRKPIFDRATGGIKKETRLVKKPLRVVWKE